MPAKVRSRDQGDKGLAEARAVLNRFTAPRAERASLRQPATIDDPWGIEAVAIELVARTTQGPGCLAAWLRRAERRGTFAAAPNPEAGNGAHVLFLDGQAMAELSEALAVFDRIQTDAARMRQLKGQA